MNSDDIVNVELIHGLTGSFAIILTVPIVAFVSAQLIPKWIKHENKNESLRY